MTSVAALVLADVNVSIGVIALMVVIALLVVLLVVLSLVETAEEHEINVERKRAAHR